MREAVDDEKGIAGRRHDNRDSFSELLDRLYGRRALGHDQIDLEANELGGKRREPLGPTVRRPIFDDEVLPFAVAEVPQPIA